MVRPASPKRLRGMAPGGPADSLAYAQAMRFSGAPEVVEVALGPRRFTVSESSWVVGAGASDGGQWPGLRWIEEGEPILINPFQHGFRLYLAVCREPSPTGQPARLPLPPSVTERHVVRLAPGPHRVEWGDRPLPNANVSVRLNRVGVTLDLAEGPTRHEFSVSSLPTEVGSIEWTPDGRWIVLGVDGPVTGGYPQPFVVAADDRAKMGQWRPGDQLSFREIPPN